MFKMKLRGRFLAPTLAVIVAGMLLTTVLAYRASNGAIRTAMSSQVEQIASSVSQQIASWIGDLQTDIAAFEVSAESSLLAALADRDAYSVGSSNRKLLDFANSYGQYEFMALADAAGNTVAASDPALVDQLKVGDRDYFKKAMADRMVVSDILASKVSGKPICVLAMPVTAAGRVQGVLYGAVDLTRFSSRVIDPVKVGREGYAFLMAQNGLLAAHPDKSTILSTNLRNYDFGKKMAESKNGLFIYTFNGLEKLVAFRTDERTGWTIGVGAATDDIFSAAREIRNNSILVALIVVLVAALVIIMVVNPIIGALRNGVAFAETIREGDLSRRLNLDRCDEIGQLGAALDAMAEGLNQKAQVAQTIAAGDLTAEVPVASQKDVLGLALQKMLGNLATLIGQIQQSGEQIASGSLQVADTSQSLSQGATESASSLEQISASMHELASQTRLNSENASQADQLVGSTRDTVEKGNRQMQQMVDAMGEINAAGQNISKIMKVIEEIAFQTNLLALNAAVEAARAGQHGKGFAVVAEEVRNLAGRSAQAAKETESLIAGSVKKAQDGVVIADEAASSLKEIVTEIAKVTDLVGEIAAASQQQSEGIEQVTQGLGQIDQVTQQNTANAEESAAAAEELSGQAEEMRKMLGRFRLSQTGAAGAIPSAKAPSAPSAPARLPKAEPPQAREGADARDPRAVIALDSTEFGRY